ncbi:MAG: molybdenum cofactor guanylyltransferase [Nitrospirae bacterium]|nr:molybdenum cofactor guanylyltransferase [Nitrospirota bacterium]
MNKLVKGFTGVILAGGENKRMPLLKAFIEINGEKIIERNLKIMKNLFREIFIITNTPELYVYLGVPMLGDIYPLKGPMAGIFTSLINSRNPWVFISACDMPFINKELILYMTSKTGNCDAVVPEFRKNIEPLFALYSKRLADDMEKAILNNKTGLQDFLRQKRVKYITKGEIKSFDPDERSFINLNTPEDIQREKGGKECLVLG